MESSRKFDEMGMWLCSKQAELFALSGKLPFGSSRFIKRFVFSSYCKEFDNLSIFYSISNNEDYLESEMTAKPDKASKYPDMVMHWIGYMYRYWSYVKNKPASSIYHYVPPKKMAAMYNAYHSLDPQQVIDIIEEAFPEEPIYERFKRAWLTL